MEKLITDIISTCKNESSDKLARECLRKVLDMHVEEPKRPEPMDPTKPTDLRLQTALDQFALSYNDFL